MKKLPLCAGLSAYNSLRQMLIPPELSQKRRLVHLMHEGYTFRVLQPVMLNLLAQHRRSHPS